MTQHFTRNTVSVTFYRGKCKRTTPHRIDHGRKGPCLECIAALEEQHALELKAEAEKRQMELWS